MVLCDHLYQAEFDKMKIRAAFFGVNLDKETEEKSTKKTPNNVFAFGSPEDYEHLSKGEREELTKKMMNVHRQWVAGRKQIGEVV